MDGARLVIFSDLDGTLLDHETYVLEAAKPALARLKALDIPLVLASSKTAAEVADIREAIGFSHCPAIVENGAGILAANAEPDEIRETHRKLLALLDQLPAKLRRRFESFSDWSLTEVCKHTGLSPDQARRARKRQFSEPGLWKGSAKELDAFTEALAGAGISAQQGGRFLTLSFGASKADRMRELAQQFRQEDRANFTIALGDAPNDLEMLLEADIGIVIPNPAKPEHARQMLKQFPTLKCASAPGPSGWNQYVLQTVSQACSDNSVS